MFLLKKKLGQIWIYLYEIFDYCFLFLKKVFICLWWCWVFIAARAFLCRGSSVAAVRGFSLRYLLLLWSLGYRAHRLQQVWAVGSVLAIPRLQSTGSVVVVHGFSSSATWGVFPNQGRTMSPASAGKFFITEPPGKPCFLLPFEFCNYLILRVNRFTHFIEWLFLRFIHIVTCNCSSFSQLENITLPEYRTIYSLVDRLYHCVYFLLLWKWYYNYFYISPGACARVV